MAFRSALGALLLMSLAIHQVGAAGLGEACVDSTNCTESGVVCIDSVCVCDTGYYTNQSQCLVKIDLGSTCPSDVASTVPCKDPAAKCSGTGTTTCQCTSNYYESYGSTLNGTCQAKIDLGSTCPSDVAPTVPCKDPAAECSGTGTTTCQCTANYYDSNGNTLNGTCQAKIDLGSTCPSNVTSTVPCKDPAAECSGTGTTCQCTGNYYDDNGSTLNGTCQAKIDLGSTCPSDVASTVPCKDPAAECSGTGTTTCQCTGNYYDSNGTCQAKVPLGSGCSSDTACASENSQCSSFKCSCMSDFYDSNGDTPAGSCSPKKRLGYTCPSNVASTVPCKDPAAECSGTGTTTCQCTGNYYDDNGSTLNGTCQAKKSLGSSCPDPNTSEVAATDSCSDPQSTCKTDSISGYTCQCKDGYYNNNGQCTLQVQLGSGCSSNSACVTENSQCPTASSVCSCTSDFYDSNGDTLAGSCSPKVNLGKPCPQSDACGTRDAVCNSKTICVCGSGYYDSNGPDADDGSCELKVGLGTNCPQPDACQPPNSECSSISGTCVCSSGYYQSGASCQPKVDLGSSCYHSDACKDKNSNCNQQQTCTCNSGYYDSDGSGTIGGNCVSKVGLGSSCLQPDSCGTGNAVCSNSNGGGTCICNSNYYDDNGVGTADGACVRKVQLGFQCPMPDACETTSSKCVGGTCQCNDTFYDDNTANNQGGSCTARVLLNRQCASIPINSYGQIDQCLDANAGCRYTSSIYTCTCNSGYHQEGTGCVANKPLGGACNYRSDCSDPNADCLGNKCICGTNYYDSNGYTNEGNCKEISDLQVTGVTFSNVTTSSITISWTLPSDSTHINLILVTWTPGGQDSQTQTVSVQSSLAIATNISPGRAYRFTVISRNTQTQQGSNRDTEVSSVQAAKPATPTGPIEGTDLDVGDNRITLTWPAISYVSGYDVKLMDGDQVIAQTFLSFNTWGLYNTNLLNGKRYNVTIVSRSETFASSTNNLSAYVTSVSYKEQIKTVVKAPGIPINTGCQTKDSYSIQLTWSEPTYPNGDLVQYFVEVFEQITNRSVAHQGTGTTVTGYLVENLKPGFTYYFKVKTENEKFNSTLVNVYSCVTTSGKSGRPENLTVSTVTSRSVTLSWEYPEKINSEEIFGYILQIRDPDNTCVHQTLFKCSNCLGTFQESILGNILCLGTVRQPDQSVNNQDLSKLITYTASENILPYINYTVGVSAVNGHGQGNVSMVTQQTEEEEPQIPSSVGVTDIQPTSMIVTWTLAGPRPGRTNFTIQLTADNPAQSPFMTVQGFDKNNAVVSGLQEYWGYTVAVTASTSKGSRTKTSEKYFTKPAAPGAVDAFTVSTPNNDHTKRKISWKIPTILERNSNITGFIFTHNATDDGANDGPKTLKKEVEDSYMYTEELDVTPEEYYMFKVFAINDQQQNGTTTERKEQAPAGIPKNEFESVSRPVIPEKRIGVSQTSISLVVMRGFLNQTRNGKIRLTGLIGCEQSKCSDTGSMSFAQFKTMEAYGVASKQAFTPYRITDDNWQNKANNNAGRKRRAVADEELQFTVGTDNCDPQDNVSYCNGPLSPDTSYKIYVVTCTNGGCLVSNAYGPFTTEKVPKEDSSLGIIIGAVVGGVVLIAIIVIIIVVMYKRRQSPAKMTKMPEAPADVIATVDQSDIPKKRPVKLSDFEPFLERHHRDSNLLFSSDYEDLKAICPKHSQNAANEDDNKMKNRYINILPFDHSRVKLIASGEEDSNDYINGNYLPGYRSPREYIGCQGPIPGTIDDFWRMVWEQNVSVVVMLTLCKEGQKIKCEQYWPSENNDPKQFGDVVVEVTSYSSIKTYDYRVFKLVCNGRTRILKHFHFLSWLDFQANVQHEIILDFITQVRSHVQPPDTAGPMIVHCSAGVGRTGTYIVLDHLMQFIEDHDFDVTVDIFDMVMRLRDNRPHMVQTEQQYVFIHDCVKVLLEKKRIALAEQNNIYENRAFDTKGENIYQNQEELTYENCQVGQMKTEL